MLKNSSSLSIVAVHAAESEPAKVLQKITITSNGRYKLNIVFIETDFTMLKQALVEHCMQWQQKLLQLLNQQARKELDDVYEYFEQNSEILLKTPKTFEELKERIQLKILC